MGRRKLRRVVWDAWEEKDTVEEVTDDRVKARKVKTQADFAQAARGNGVVSNTIWQMKLFDYGADGEMVVSAERTKEAAENLTKSIENTRFYGMEEHARQRRAYADEFGISEKKAANMEQRDAQYKALAIQSAARAGKVKLSSYHSGIVNRLADGKYDDTVWGSKNEKGDRTYERGTYISKMGLDQGRSASSKGDARAAEAARVLREYRYGDMPTGGSATPDYSGLSRSRSVQF